MSEDLALVRKYEPVLLFSTDGQDRPEEFFPLAAQHYVHRCGLRRKKNWEHLPGRTLLRHLGFLRRSKECNLAYATGDLPEAALELLDQGFELARFPETRIPPRVLDAPAWDHQPLSGMVVPRLLVRREDVEGLKDPLSAWGEVEKKPLDVLLADLAQDARDMPAVGWALDAPVLAPEEAERQPSDLEEATRWFDELEDPAIADELKAVLGDLPAPDVRRRGPVALHDHLTAKPAMADWDIIALRSFAALSHSIVQKARENYGPYRDRPAYHYNVRRYRAKRGKTYRALQYWFLYAFNDWAAHGGYNDHEGDWEMVCVFLNEKDEPEWVASSIHVLKPQKARWEELPVCDQWEDLRHADQALWRGSHPVVFVGCGSHANYLRRKTYHYWLFGT